MDWIFCLLNVKLRNFRMENKETVFWSEFSRTMINFTRFRAQKCVVNAMCGLNIALMDLYATMNKPHSRKEFDQGAGFVLQYVALIDWIKGNESDLSYSQETVPDPIDKEALLTRARMISHLAMQHYPREDRSDKKEWRSEFEASREDNEMLTVNLRRILMFIMSRSWKTLRELASSHVSLLRGEVDSE